MHESFKTFIDALTHQHGTAGAVAKAIGMSLSAFSRGVRIEGSLGVDKCLRLAKWAGVSPSHVLRLANKGEVAELIEELYGREGEPLSGSERELLGLWRTIDKEGQRAMQTLIRGLSSSAGKTTRQSNAPTRKRA